MTVREQTEEIERHILSPFAKQASESEGRERYEEPCGLRTVFQRDRDRIIHSKSFRRLKHKTQVFLAPEGDHYRTRLTHTLEVSQIARTISRALRLNEDLTEAIALGHDIGHTPFGHAGEKSLDEVCSKGFRHYTQSVRVVQKLEHDGKGLNLTKEVLDGIERHTCGKLPSTLEGCVVRLSDKIAYINHDIDDAIRAGMMCENDIPEDIRSVLGNSHSARINTLITDTVQNSMAKGSLMMSGQVENAFEKIHQFMFDNVYVNSIAKSEEYKVQYVVKQLFHFFCENVDKLNDEYRAIAGEDGTETAVCDYIAGMTDTYAVQVYSDLFIPGAWKKS